MQQVILTATLYSINIYLYFSRFLRGKCENIDGSCPFSHNISKEKVNAENDESPSEIVSNRCLFVLSSFVACVLVIIVRIFMSVLALMLNFVWTS